MTDYKAEEIPSHPTGLWKVVQYLDDKRITAVAYAVSAIWAQRIVNALSQMEIEG